MAAQMTRKEKARLEVLYKNGETINEICHRLRISHRTVHYHANLNGWKHGESKKDYQKKLAIKESEAVIQEGLGEADRLRDSYMRKIQVLENMTSAALRGLGSTPEEIRNISQSEANRIFTVLKSLKISSEISNIHYESARKALGLDKLENKNEDEILPIKINVTTEPKVIEDEEDEGSTKDND